MRRQLSLEGATLQVWGRKQAPGQLGWLEAIHLMTSRLDLGSRKHEMKATTYDAVVHLFCLLEKLCVDGKTTRCRSLTITNQKENNTGKLRAVDRQTEEEEEATSLSRTTALDSSSFSM